MSGTKRKMILQGLEPDPYDGDSHEDHHDDSNESLKKFKLTKDVDRRIKQSGLASKAELTYERKEEAAREFLLPVEVKCRNSSGLVAPLTKYILHASNFGTKSITKYVRRTLSR